MVYSIDVIYNWKYVWYHPNIQHTLFNTVAHVHQFTGPRKHRCTILFQDCCCMRNTTAAGNGQTHVNTILIRASTIVCGAGTNTNTKTQKTSRLNYPCSRYINEDRASPFSPQSVTVSSEDFNPTSSSMQCLAVLNSRDRAPNLLHLVRIFFL